MITSVIGGYISDRMGKRKIFVIVSTLVICSGRGDPGLRARRQQRVDDHDDRGADISGIGYGWYLAVDQALITQVLPTAGDRAKDLGVINIANSMPQVLAPGAGRAVCVTGTRRLQRVSGPVPRDGCHHAARRDRDPAGQVRALTQPFMIISALIGHGGTAGPRQRRDDLAHRCFTRSTAPCPHALNPPVPGGHAAACCQAAEPGRSPAGSRRSRTAARHSPRLPRRSPPSQAPVVTAAR
ncbi:MAG: hypothetical protein V9G10_08330 [Candidatus Nanopelagicales bacterium]